VPVNPIMAVLDRARRLIGSSHYPFPHEGLLYHGPLTLAKRRNLALQVVNRQFLKFGEIALPHTLHIGVTTACNLRCPACPTGTRKLGRSAQHLDFDVYRRVVDELRDALMFMLFWDWGEPLLHPRLADMIEYAGRSGIMTVTSTNGNVPFTDEQMDRLVAARPSVVIACVDGTDQATYEKYRTGGQLSKALDTISRLRRAKDSLRSEYPVIEFRSLALRDNQHQMPGLLRLARERGADLFTVKSLRPFDCRGADVDDTLVPLDDNLSRYEYKDARRKAVERQGFRPRGPLTCGLPYYAPTLNSDGTAVFCSYSVDPLEQYGDVSQEGFLKIWKSRFARENRLRFTRLGGTDSCETCFFRSNPKPCVRYNVPLRPLPAGVSVQSPVTDVEFLDAVAPTSGQ
jgi:MoaA/NifB/PqqE/SkfB family radical SAM enzyme